MEKEIVHYMRKAKGYRMIYMEEEGIIDKCLLDGCNGMVLINVIRDISKDGVLKCTQKYYAEKMGVTERSIQNHWALLKKHKIIKQVKKVTYVNPYVALPYNVKDEDANRIQQHWDSLWYDEV